MTDKDIEIVDLRGRINSLEILGKRYETRIAELEAALRRSADTFGDFEKTCRMLDRIAFAQACAIAHEDAERVLAGSAPSNPTAANRRGEPTKENF